MDDDVEDRFAGLVGHFTARPGVTGPDGDRRRFGSDALKVGGSIFAMLSRGRFVVKLPAERVASLIRAGTGSAFDAGKGRPMKEWVVVVSTDDEVWSALAEEALAFVDCRRLHP